MKKRRKPRLSEEQAASQRIAILEEQFRSVSDVLTTLTENIDQPDGHPPKALMTKLMELQSIHFAVIKAHEAFHEKYDSNDTGINYDKIRDDIGRQLDRIRTVLEIKGISGGPNAG